MTVKKSLNEVWKVKEGSKTIWKVQAVKGILSFNRKKDAIKCAEVFGKEMNKYGF